MHNDSMVVNKTAGHICAHVPMLLAFLFEIPRNLSLLQENNKHSALYFFQFFFLCIACLFALIFFFFFFFYYFYIQSSQNIEVFKLKSEKKDKKRIASTLLKNE